VWGFHFGGRGKSSSATGATLHTACVVSGDPTHPAVATITVSVTGTSALCTRYY
jgi:hypothetical protein